MAEQTKAKRVLLLQIPPITLKNTRPRSFTPCGVYDRNTKDQVCTVPGIALSHGDNLTHPLGPIFRD